MRRALDGSPLTVDEGRHSFQGQAEQLGRPHLRRNSEKGLEPEPKIIRGGKPGIGDGPGSKPTYIHSRSRHASWYLWATGGIMGRKARARMELSFLPPVAVRKACRACLLAAVSLLCVVLLCSRGAGAAAGAAAGGRSRHNNNWAVLVR